MVRGAPVLTMRHCAAADVRDVLMEAERRGRGEAGDTIARLLPRGQCFAVEHDGQIVGAYLLEVTGTEVFILAAAGRAEFDMTAVFAVLIEQQAAQFSSVAFKTKRPGLVRKAQALGYVAEGDILRKRLTQ